MLKKSLSNLLLSFILPFALLLSSCGLIQIKTNATKPIIPSVTASTPFTQIIETPLSIETQNNLSVPIRLNPEGQWLIYPTTEGIKAANSDGSGSVLIASTSITNLVASEPDIPSGVSPNGRFIAHRKNSPDGKGWELEIIHLPDLNRQTITPLISESNLTSMENDPGQDMLLTSAIVFESPVQWSPDGRYLAFVAALDGPSSDLYVYDTVTQKITHTTSGELEVARPVWTPDGSEVIYQVVTTFGTGAGWTANGVRAVKPDGSGDRLIYRNPNGTGPETFLGITKDGIALVDHFDPRGGGLYLVNIATGELHLLIANYLSAAMDPVNGDYVFLDGDGKLYFSSKPDPQYKQVNDLLYTNGKVYWDMHYIYFIILAEGIAGVDPFGNYVEFRGVPFLAYDNHSRCDVTYGIECDTPNGIFTIPDAYGATVYWTPDSRGFFYILNDGLYYVATRTQKAVKIDSGLLSPNPQDYRMIEFNAVWVK
jgi:dipeptidyl aminopeptidase/acylaminoacyl peptidase